MIRAIVGCAPAPTLPNYTRMSLCPGLGGARPVGAGRAQHPAPSLALVRAYTRADRNAHAPFCCAHECPHYARSNLFTRQLLPAWSSTGRRTGRGPHGGAHFWKWLSRRARCTRQLDASLSPAHDRVHHARGVRACSQVAEVCAAALVQRCVRGRRRPTALPSIAPHTQEHFGCKECKILGSLGGPCSRCSLRAISSAAPHPALRSFSFLYFSRASPLSPSLARVPRGATACVSQY